MYDINGKTLHIGDEVYTVGTGIAKIVSVEEEDNVKHEGALVKLTYANGYTGSCRLLFAKVVKVRTWKELAQFALDVQGACNLSGVVHSFSDTIREVRIRLETSGKGGTDAVNTHPVCRLFSDKIAHLTETQSVGHQDILAAYAWAHDIVGGKVDQ